MKFAAVVSATLKILQLYRLSKRRSTAIEVSLAVVASWIRILVRPIKKNLIIIIQILLMSITSSRSLFRIVYYRSRPITSLEHIQYTNLAKALRPWSVLQSGLRCRHVVWRDGDSSTALLERKSSSIIFEN
jgi:hypothetical protein